MKQFFATLLFVFSCSAIVAGCGIVDVSPQQAAEECDAPHNDGSCNPPSSGGSGGSGGGSGHNN